MRWSSISRTLLTIGVCAPVFGQALSSSRFDGDWTVSIDCPSNTEESGAKGYRFQFPAVVKDGVLAASVGMEGWSASLRIEGPIRSDGSAELRARGRTGNPEYAAKQPLSGTPYSYRIKAQFDDDKGTGSRIETRVCNFVFARK
ncbi:MAG: hypothetical protein ACR2GP_16430 [Burkholderiaceae bacterium]